MKKLKLLLLSGLLIAFQFVWAQPKTVTGKVVSEDGTPLAGANVSIKGTRVAATTNSSGVFTINVPASGKTLVISYVGLGTAEVSIEGVSGSLQITLKPAKAELTEVVVTALGIKREKKALGYAVATVDKKQLEERPDGDVVRLLQGKAPGVDIQGVSGMSGSGTNIIIRGVSTITGNATPLFVVDGVPFDASTNPQANFVYGNTSSSRFLDLDPNNIESISILKGLSATTLYGEQGRNGVVLITTKNGANRRTNKKAEVTVTQSLFVNRVANLPTYQDDYGGGFDQSLGLAFFSNWGAKFTNPPALVTHPYDRSALSTALPQFSGIKYEYKPYNSVSRFFRTGIIQNTSINVAASGSNGTFNANFGYLDDEGFTPGNSLYKSNFGMGGSFKLSNNITISGTFNYANTNFKAPPTSTSFGSNPSVSSVFGNLIYTPRAVNLMGSASDSGTLNGVRFSNYLPWENPLDHSSIYYRGGNDIQNPIWTVNNSFTGQKVNRIFGTMQVKYDILKNLNITYRFGFDNYSNFDFLAQNKGGTVGGNDYTLGVYRTVDEHSTVWSHTAIATWNKTLSSDFVLNLEGGADAAERIFSQSGMRSTQQLVYGFFNHDNFINHLNTSEDGSNMDYQSHVQTVGIFTNGTLSFREYLYFTAGGRASFTSNLEKGNRHLFYPSGSIAFIPTSFFEFLKSSKAINYLKLRAGYSTSANFGFPYATRPTLSISTNVFVDRASNIINANSIPNRLANPGLKPELLSEIEVGVEGKFWDNRISLDLSLYKRVSKDQILDRQLDPATGYTVTAINAGNVRNQGIELGLGVTVFSTQNWRWQLDGNFTLNRNKVYNLPSDIKQIVIDGFTNEGLFAIDGQPLGVIQDYYTQKYNGNVKGAVGQRIVGSDGNYVSSTEIGIIGDPNPKYKTSGISTLSYKGFSFRAQVDFTCGGDMLAYTPGTLVGRGLTKDTDFDRTLPWILPGVKADGTPNDKQISSSEAYFNNLSGFFGMADLITYDATVVRLREASLSYNLPTSLLKKSPFGEISVTVSGQNLWYYAPNFPKYCNFDPETSSLGVSNVRGLEYLSGPTSRRFGASIRVTF